jgi:hypothetical protein
MFILKRWSASVLLFILILTVLQGIAVFAISPDDKHEPIYGAGLIWDTWQNIEAALREDVPLLEFALPLSVDLTGMFPAPRNQGGQNSCVAWAIAYALRSHQEQVKQNWGLNTDYHLFSPAYIYNQRSNRNEDNGMTVISAFEIINEQGVSTLASFPYNENDHFTQPTAAQRAEASQFKILEWYAIRGINSIKTHLANGDGVILGIRIYNDFRTLNPSNKIFDTVSGSSMGNHVVCIIGYNDSLGAFKFINSWGTGWGDYGYGWISYELVDDIRINYHGEAIGFVMISHASETFTEGSFEYSVSNLGEAAIVRYIGIGGDVIIPDALGGYPVTAIGRGAFQNSTITSIFIHDGVRDIGAFAFKDSLILESAVIGNGVTFVGASAFSGCRMLTNVILGDNMTYLSQQMFNDCILLKTIDIPDNVTLIDSFAFYNCRSLTDIVIPSSVTFIGEKAFHNFSSILDNLTIHSYLNSYAHNYAISNHFRFRPLGAEEKSHYSYTIFNDEVTITGYYGFGGSITIPDVIEGYPVTAIGNRAFQDCTLLTDVVIPNSVISIGFWAFSGCINLTDVIIPDSVIMISAGMFAFCSGLTNVIIGSGVTVIEDFAFLQCMNLTSITIPASVTYIGEFALHYIYNWGNYYLLPNLTIACFKNTYAHYYAIANGIPFTLIGMTVPNVPTNVSAIAGNRQATVSFTPPHNNGGSTITSYTVVASPNGITAKGTTSPITVTGLTNGTSYTFTVMASNDVGMSSASATSNAITPTDVPATGIVSMTAITLAMGTFIVFSITLWGYFIYCRLRESKL